MKWYIWMVCFVVHNLMSIDERYEKYAQMIEDRMQQKPEKGALRYKSDMYNLLESLIATNVDEYALIDKVFTYDPSLMADLDACRLINACVIKGRPKTLRYLLEKNIPTMRDKNFFLHNFLSENLKEKIACMQLLLMYNENPNKQDYFGVTALSKELSYPLGLKLLPREVVQKKLLYLIVSGADHTIPTYEHFGSHTNSNNKTVSEMARDNNGDDIADFIEHTVGNRTQLFDDVQHGVDISLCDTQGISRRHVRDIHGNSLLYYAIKAHHYRLVKKLLYLWPQLLAQPNFNHETVIDLLPIETVSYLLDRTF